MNMISPSQSGRMARILLEPGNRITMNGHSGIVTELRPDGCLILWDETVDRETGEVFTETVRCLSHEDIEQADHTGRLHLLNAPGAVKHSRSPSRFDRSASETRRKQFRKAYVTAADHLIGAGEMGRSRADFSKNMERITAEGAKLDDEWSLRRLNKPRKRGGAVETNTVPRLGAPKSAANIHAWYVKWKRGGDDALFDSYRTCGRRGSRFRADEQVLMQNVISTRLDMERPSIQGIVSSVQAAFHMHNNQIVPGAEEQRLLTVPGYDAVRNAIGALAPIDHAIRTRGLKVAYRDMHALGIGVTTSRALQRVEIDEYTLDLMVLLRKTGVLELLSEEQAADLGLDGSAKRMKLSAAIDVHTRCLLGLKVAPEISTALLRETVEMIFSDKSSISDSVAQMDWPMSGKPEAIVLDRGPAYIDDETYDLLAELGITNLGAAARKPWLRPFIERLFRTVHDTLLQRFPGRTFSNVFRKGENNPGERAAITLEELLEWLVRWVVDIYHLTPHAGLNGQRPYEAWQAAMAVHRPQGIRRREMRLIFGTRLRRKVSRAGIRIFHLDYQTDSLQASGLREAEIAWWPGDIGAIEVKTGPDRWLTVTVKDPDWIGKSYDDLCAYQSRYAAEAPEYETIRDQAIAELDGMSARKKALRGLIPINMTPERLRLQEEDFRRHMDTADRRMSAGMCLDLFADEVLPETAGVSDPEAAYQSTSQPQPRSSSQNADDHDDLME